MLVELRLMVGRMLRAQRTMLDWSRRLLRCWEDSMSLSRMRDGRDRLGEEISIAFRMMSGIR